MSNAATGGDPRDQLVEIVTLLFRCPGGPVPPVSWLPATSFRVSRAERVPMPVPSPALYGKVGPGEFGLMVTLGAFSQPAKHFAARKTNLRMIDGNELVDIVLQHYEEFDSRYKGLLPLKRVYVPNPLDEGD